MAKRIPKLIGRDPRNADHIQAALAMLTELSTAIVTQQSADEIARFGGTLPKNVKIRKKHGKHDLVVCTFFFLERGLLLPDNIIVKCADCHAALEVRPLNDTRAVKLCCFCAVDRLIAER